MIETEKTEKSYPFSHTKYTTEEMNGGEWLDASRCNCADFARILQYRLLFLDDSKNVSVVAEFTPASLRKKNKSRTIPPERNRTGCSKANAGESRRGKLRSILQQRAFLLNRTQNTVHPCHRGWPQTTPKCTRSCALAAEASACVVFDHHRWSRNYSQFSCQNVPEASTPQVPAALSSPLFPLFPLTSVFGIRRILRQNGRNLMTTSIRLMKPKETMTMRTRICNRLVLKRVVANQLRKSQCDRSLFWELRKHELKPMKYICSSFRQSDTTKRRWTENVTITKLTQKIFFTIALPNSSSDLTNG